MNRKRELKPFTLLVGFFLLIGGSGYGKEKLSPNSQIANNKTSFSNSQPATSSNSTLSFSSGYKPVPPTLVEILAHPPSITRDFFITQYLRSAQSFGPAYKGFKGLKRVRLLHWKLLGKRFPTQFGEAYRCVDVRPKWLKEVNPGCILEGGLSYRTLYRLSISQKKYLLQTLPPYSQMGQVVKLLVNRDYSTILHSSRWTAFFLRHFPSFLKPVFSKINWHNHLKEVAGLIHSTAIYGYSHYLPFFNRLGVELIQTLPRRAKWDLTLIAIRQNRIARAVEILKSIKQKTPKHYFWLWLLTKNKKYLQYIADHFHRVNFYTLYAYEEVGKKFQIITKVNRNSVKNPPFNQYDPWSVAEFKRYLSKIRKNRSALLRLATRLDSDQSFALKAYVLDIAHNFNRNYFLIPWSFYRDKDRKFRAFVYAIARQESRFIPGEVSIAYALGPMQVMPFLVRHYKGNIYNQFNYGENVELGVKELKGLFKSLKNPLFVAYAYNGGIGFVKRNVIPKFKWNGKYQPFLSMELVPKYESRHYGKVVLANYIIYRQLFGDKNFTLHRWIASHQK